MCFRADVLRRVPHRAFSIVEDLEYGIQLAHAGVRVAYVADAHVYGDMPTAAGAAGSQRARWEGGRRAIARRHAGPLLRAAVARRDAVLLDVALDVVTPPLSRLVATVAAGLVVTVAATLWLGRGAIPAVALWALSAAALVGYVARGMVMSGNGIRGLRDLAWVPIYVLWNFAVRRRAGVPDTWVRTDRVSSPRE
jgi:hypothetical protein